MGRRDKADSGEEQHEALPLELPAEPAPSADAPQDLLKLAVANGQTFHRRGKDGKLYPIVPEHDTIFRREHAIADVLHGWTLSERTESLPVLLNQADYVAAIEAAKSGKTHAPANRRKEGV